MFLKNSICFLSLLWLPIVAQAQQNDTATPIQIRAVLHDPVNPTAEFFLTDNTGAVVKLELRPQDLSRPQVTLAVNGSLVLYNKAVIDPEKPDANLAASCKIPPNTKRGVVVILPTPGGSKASYRMVFLDDSAKAFPRGESRILTLIPLEVAIEAGEHKLPIHPGAIANLPAVKKVNEYHMAQTNFYFKQGEVWTAITERQLQYLDDVRRIFIVHVTPGALLPVVTTIIDTTTP